MSKYTRNTLRSVFSNGFEGIDGVYRSCNLGDELETEKMVNILGW